jgi:hypothetical protein
MLANRQAADKEGLDRLFNSGTIFPPPSASPDGEKNEKPEEQEKKGSDGEGDNGAKKKREKESPDPTNKKNPGDADKPVKKGAAQPEADKKKPEQNDSDNNSHEKKTNTPFKSPYAACWSPDSYRPELFEQINKRWWSSDSDKNNLLAAYGPIGTAFLGSHDGNFGLSLYQPGKIMEKSGGINSNGQKTVSDKNYWDSFSLGSGLLESQKYLAEWQIKDNIISAKAESIKKQDLEYIKLEENKKRLLVTPESKFLKNITNLGFGKLINLGFGDIAFDNATSMIDTLTHQGVKREEKRINIRCYKQAEGWYKTIENRKKIVQEEKNNPPNSMPKMYQIILQEEKDDLRTKEEEMRDLSIEKLKCDIAENRHIYKIHSPPFDGSQEEYSRAPALLEPVKNLLSSVKTDKFIEIFSSRYGKVGKVVGHGITYLKDKAVEEIDQSLGNIEQHNLGVDALRAAARKVLEKYYKAKASNFSRKNLKQDISSFNDPSEPSEIIHSTDKDCGSPLILPGIFRN